MHNKTDKVTLAEIRLSGICPSCKRDRLSHHEACIRLKSRAGRHLVMSYNPIRQKLTCKLTPDSGSMTYKCSFEDYNQINNAWKSLQTVEALSNVETVIYIKWD